MRVFRFIEGKMRLTETCTRRVREEKGCFPIVLWKQYHQGAVNNCYYRNSSIIYHDVVFNKKKTRYPKIYQSSLDFYRMKHKSTSIYHYAHVKNIQTNIIRKCKGLTESFLGKQFSCQICIHRGLKHSERQNAPGQTMILSKSHPFSENIRFSRRFIQILPTSTDRDRDKSLHNSWKKSTGIWVLRMKKELESELSGTRWSPSGLL